MNHDYSHCLDFNDSCPKKCFRAKLVRDLRRRKDMVGVPISWTHYKGTDECPKVERKEEFDCNDCYYSMQNCKDKTICCEDETALCDNFEPVVERKEE